jgi:uncharacterized heparinase superfamily protein
VQTVNLVSGLLTGLIVREVHQYSVLRNPGLYFRTLRHLRWSQFYYLVVRRLLPAPKFPESAASGYREGISSIDWMGVPQPGDIANEFRFLNETKSFDPAAIDWSCEDQKKLWRYNLHYFDFLHWECFSDDLKATLISSWIESCPMNRAIAWDPYPVSLRIVNWIKYFDSAYAHRRVPQRWLDSLMTQARWQASNMEYQILANHLVKNAKALVFAGAFFTGEQAKEFMKLGCNVMWQQLGEQFMADGGHFERSHMYHLIVTEDYLDVLNLAVNNELPMSAAELLEMHSKVHAAVEYYSDLCAADGELQLFNDSAHGITVNTATFLSYARRVLKEPVAEPNAELKVINKAATGYYGYRTAGDSLLIDCGSVGPDYQPGHAHCDTLSFTLSIGGCRVVVDSGVYTYEHVPIRYANRQTAGHNTVRVDGEEQSEVWHSWRVGRRAYPITAKLTDYGDGRLSFVGAHDGYARLPGRVFHERQFDIDLAGVWRIIDRVQGSGEHLLESYVHLHPDIQVVQEAPDSLLLERNGAPIALLQLGFGQMVSLERSDWCPEFGVKYENIVLVMRHLVQLPATMEYTITKLYG